MASNIMVVDYTLHPSIFLLAASGPGRCKINNGGCWHDSQDGQSFSACLVGDIEGFIFIYLFIYFCSFQQIDLDVNSSFYYQQDIDGGKCECPPGFKGDGVKSCKGKRC